MKVKFKITIGFLAVYLCVLNFYICRAEVPAGSSGAAFEEALKNYESYKQKEQDEVAKKINLTLNQEVEDWIARARKGQDSLIGTRVEQNWEKLALYFPISPAYYDYYLRGYRYDLIKDDVIKSESITSPYKAGASIKEELYVEKYHSPDISDRDPYFFTVTTVYHLNFEYRQGKLELINTDKKIINIENTAPLEIKKQFL